MIRNFFSKKPAVIEQEPEPTVRNSVFSTGGENIGNKSLRRRQMEAMAHTFQRGVESIKPVDTSGEIDFAMDEAYPDLTQAKLVNSRGGYLPITQLEWYGNQGFIGWQMAAVMSQNWLIDKACGVPAQDAIRKGYTITLNDGEKLDPEVLNTIRLADKKMNINGKLKSFIKKGRIFGVRHAMFMIDGIDYEAPFNPDGILAGSYKGIAQIDPYWIAPLLDRDAAANPASPEFYEPTWWMVNGKRVHRTHFIIMRNGDEVVDILKPAYFYGGIPIPQKIFERVYAAERTANEAPMLALSKRMTTLNTDTSQAFGPDNKFNEVMNQQAEYRNNWGFSVYGLEDKIQQFDTSLAEFNETINTQYGLVASAANIPITKLLGTPPTGMNATGEYDEANYHEEIESIQMEIGTPFVERHHLCLMRSYIAPKFGIAPLNTEIRWNPLDSYTTKEKAEINAIKANTAKTYADAGAIDGTDIRMQIIGDPDSDFGGIDPIVPNGPGDRQFAQEQAELLTQSVQENNQAEDSAIYAGVLYRAENKFLLLKYRDEKNGGVWSFPAGHVEPEETSLDAALREFQEETGKAINTATPVYADDNFILYQTYGEEFTPALCDEHSAYVWADRETLPTPLHVGVDDQLTMIYNNAL